ncbi:unnamed protein product, partial [Mesorhabditis spiculigera]
MRRAAVWTTTVWALMAAVAEGYQSSYNYVPQGSSPTLYTPGFEPIMHLDQNTFADTVFAQDKSFVVEFYADWSVGHCRAFVPYFREFANQVFGWNKHFPVLSVLDRAATDGEEEEDLVDGMQKILKNSERARLVFTHMREWLEARKGYGHFPSLRMDSPI